MQTFLPYTDFKKTFKCLDYRRLGKQRVEAMQILNTLTNKTNKKGWQNHPAVKMWRGSEELLKLYMNQCIEEWIHRGYNNTMKFADVDTKKIKYPEWFHWKDILLSHRANLIRKLPDHYNKFNWNVTPQNGYIWPIEENGKWTKIRINN